MYVRWVGTSSWVQLRSHATFGLESELEMLLAESPELLPGQPTNLAVVRQLHIPTVNGYLDLCGVAPDGTLSDRSGHHRPPLRHRPAPHR